MNERDVLIRERTQKMLERVKAPFFAQPSRDTPFDRVMCAKVKGVAEFASAASQHIASGDVRSEGGRIV